MSINKKDFDILEELILNPSLSISYFANKYNVSDRNIRYTVENLNFYLNKENFPIINIKKGTLETQISIAQLKDFYKSIDINNYNFSKEERENYILISFLFSDECRISELEKILNVSRPTIKKDILNLQNFLKNFELNFIREENSLFITGKEKKLRHLKLLKLMDYIEIKNREIVFFSPKYFLEEKEQIIIKKYIKDIDIEKHLRVIDKIEKKLNVKFELSFKNIMLLYFIPTIERIKKDHIILKKDNSQFLKELKDYKIIKSILSEIIDPKFEFEIFHLTEYFLSGYYTNDFSENIYIVEKFINKLSLSISSTFNIDFTEFNDFREELIHYLLPAIYRIKNNFCLNNTIDINSFDKQFYYKLKNIVLENNNILKEPLREEEISHIIKILEKFIKSYSQNKISLKELLSIVSKNSLNPDLDEIAEAYLQILGNILVDDREEDFDFGIEKLLTSNRILIFDEILSIDKALNISLALLKEQNFIKSLNDYDLISTVKKFGRYMFLDKNILFCYEKNKNNCIKPGLSLIISTKGIEVGEVESGKLFFFLASRNRIEHLKIISQLIKLSENSEFVNNILNLKTSHSIIKKIKEYIHN